MSFIKSSYLAVLLSATFFLLAHAALEASMSTDQFADNAEGKEQSPLTMHKRPSFFVGSRYGRSGTGSGFMATSAKMRRLNVVPRNDRFFLGSRYGKRANEYSSPYEQDTAEAFLPVAASQQGGSKSSPEDNTPYMMSCLYTGVKNYFRCNGVDEINNIISQLTTAHAEDDRK